MYMHIWDVLYGACVNNLCECVYGVCSKCTGLGGCTVYLHVSSLNTHGQRSPAKQIEQPPHGLVQKQLSIKTNVSYSN